MPSRSRPIHPLRIFSAINTAVASQEISFRCGTCSSPAKMPAVVALCSNTISREQAEKVVKVSREQGSGIVTIFLDCDPEGLNGMKQCLGYLAQLAPVRLAWTDRMHGGKFSGRQPESLSIQEWQEIEAFLSVCP